MECYNSSANGIVKSDCFGVNWQPSLWGAHIGNESLSRNFGDGVLRLRHGVWNAISPRARSLQSCSRVRRCTREPNPFGTEPRRTLFFLTYLTNYYCILDYFPPFWNTHFTLSLHWLILNNHHVDQGRQACWKQVQLERFYLQSTHWRVHWPNRQQLG